MQSRLIRSMQFYHLSRRAGALLVSIVLVKLGLDTESIGIFETWVYLLMLFSFFWVESLIKAFLSEIPDHRDIDEPRKVLSLYVLFFVFSLGLGVLFYIGREWVLWATTGSTSLDHLPIYLWYLILLPPIAVVPYLYQLQQKPGGITVYSIFIGIGYVLGVSLPLLSGGGLADIGRYLIYYALLGHLWFWITWFMESSNRNIIPHSVLMGRIIRVGWPLMLYAVIQSLTVVVDSAMVQWFYQDKSVFAIFRYGARELPLVAPLLAGIVSLALPLLVSDRKAGMSLIKKQSGQLIRWLFPLAILLMWIAPWLFTRVYSPEFQESASVFQVYLLLIIPQLLFPQTLVMAQRQNKALMLIGWLEVLVNILLTYFFIQTWGMIGVAWATVLAFVLEKMLILGFIQANKGPRWTTYTPVSWWAWSSVALLISYFLVNNITIW